MDIDTKKIDFKAWFIHVEWVVILVTLIGGFHMIDSKIDANIMYLNQRIDQTNARSDQLYQMFIDLLKSKKYGD